jgi:V/A-type H+-transporting ATPase subunit C
MLSESLELSKDDQISGFEHRVSNHLTQIARDGKMQTAGPERVFAFLVGLQAEIQNMKLIVNGRLNRIDQALLRQRLKEGYV